MSFWQDMFDYTKLADFEKGVVNKMSTDAYAVGDMTFAYTEGGTGDNTWSTVSTYTDGGSTVEYVVWDGMLSAEDIEKAKSIWKLNGKEEDMEKAVKILVWLEENGYLKKGINGLELEKVKLTIYDIVNGKEVK